MKFISTRKNSAALSFKDTVMQGLAPDGGLYVPEFLPEFSSHEIAKMSNMNYQEIFIKVTRHFVKDEIGDQEYLDIVAKSYANFSHKAIAPLKQIDSNHFLLELFHGPTLAFKDFALQYLGNLLDYFLKKNNKKIAIIGATSGDTGSAAISGCMKCSNAKIFILHPHKKISDVQRKQMTTIIANNVFNIAIEGNFDDGQKMVKKMFAYEASGSDFLKDRKMVAINSINFARLMAQIAYYFYSFTRISDVNSKVTFCVPTGNFGDIYAGYMAKRMGLNINKLIIATNSNDILHRFLKNNDYTRHKMISTLSPSMNIQVSSNFERLLYDYHKKHNKCDEMKKLMEDFEVNGSLKIAEFILEDIQKDFLSYKIDDNDTKKEMKTQYQNIGEIIDPHSAIGTLASSRYIASDQYSNEKVITLATAHPAKFPESVTKAGLKNAALPESLMDLMTKKEKYEVLKNDLDIVKNFISSKL
jgi:threonine synthase|tara:strand:+ start:5625 stop:7040 length:1416 start_codon:yes stop_codon:yes gene_type:complete